MNSQFVPETRFVNVRLDRFEGSLNHDLLMCIWKETRFVNVRLDRSSSIVLVVITRSWSRSSCIDHAQWYNFMKISYPYGGTINFKICLDVQLTTHQPPMPNSSQTSAWSHRYIGRGSGKTEIPLLDSERISENWMAEKTIGKSGRFRTSGSTFGSRSTGCRFGSYPAPIWRSHRIHVHHENIVIPG